MLGQSLQLTSSPTPFKPAFKHIGQKHHHKRHSLDVSARGAGGPPNFGRPSPSDDAARRLILPGQDRGPPGGGPGRIVLPNQDSGYRPSGAGLSIPGEPPQVRNFRPPPGFMNADTEDDSTSSLSVDQMLQKLRTRAGHWHELGKLIPALQSKGQTGEMVEEVTGIERRTLALWSTALPVYTSLNDNPDMPKDVLSYFDVEGGEQLLHELRFLNAKQRTAAAIYIATNQLSGQETVVLARSIKEYERRNGKKDGFGDSPADCLAYKFYRDALECRQKDAIEICVKKGLAVVETDSGRAALSSLCEGDFIQDVGGPKATLSVLRLTRDEIAFRSIAVAGSYQSVTADMIRATPKASSDGVFGNFKIPQDGVNYEWVNLPAWSIVTLAANPVILTIRDCREIEDLLSALSAKSGDELRKVSGPGLLVIDAGKKVESVLTEQYYLVEDGSKMRLIPGSNIKENSVVVARVMFLCRPPSKETASSQTSELLQL